MGLKGRVFSRRGKCMEVIQEVKLLMRRERQTEGWNSCKGKRKWNPENQRPLTGTGKTGAGPEVHGDVAVVAGIRAGS